jgi:hypothetical protein
MKKITTIFIAVSILIIAVFDLWVIQSYGKQESISAYIIRWSHEYPSIPFLFGFLCGHLFWSMKKKDIYKDNQEQE